MPARDRMRLWQLLLAVLLMLAGQRAAAHEVRPLIATAHFEPGGRYAVDISANLEALLAGIGPQHSDTDQSPEAAQYDTLRRLSPDTLRDRFQAFSARWLEGISISFDGQRVHPRIAAITVPPVGNTGVARISKVRLEGQFPASAKSFGWTYSARFGSSVLRVKQTGSQELVANWLNDGRPSGPVPISGAPAQSASAVFGAYIQHGFIHIVPEGLDHILFVLGLFFLSTHFRPLLAQVTSFTIAHTITLGLGLYGVFSVSPAIVEPLIAASIVYVAVENIMTSKLTAWRPVVVFAFGLLHGLGFAGVLREIGLERDNFVIGLVGFNIGVELGQLAVIAAAFVLTSLWFGKASWYRQRIAIPASVAIALVGAFWTVERIFFA